MSLQRRVWRKSAVFGNEGAACRYRCTVLIVHATNVHQGGGRSLLLPLLEALEAPALVHLDQRLMPLPKLPDGVEVRTYAPSVRQRFAAERHLHKTAGASDVILCFGNLPPLFPTSTRTVVFIQNRYMVDRHGLSALPWTVRVRLSVERLWLKHCLRDAELVVQTPTMAWAAERATGRPAAVYGFVATPETGWLTQDNLADQDIDFLYVASPEPHKNHRNLLLAWGILAAEGAAPSLGLTLPTNAPAELRAQIEVLQGLGAPIEVIEPCAPGEMKALYARARAMIYPSLLESFGLPLLEAQSCGLPIVAAERDYVRDIVVPRETFDPLSPVSIARAVQRSQGRAVPPMNVGDPAGFLAHLQVQA